MLESIKVGDLLNGVGWSLTDISSVRFEYEFDVGGKTEYALFDRWGRAIVVLDTKSARVNPGVGGTLKVRCANA